MMLCVMVQGLTFDWQASREWVTAANGVNIDFIAHHFGEAQVMVSDTTRYFQDPKDTHDKHLHLWPVIPGMPKK